MVIDPNNRMEYLNKGKSRESASNKTSTPGNKTADNALGKSDSSKLDKAEPDNVSISSKAQAIQRLQTAIQLAPDINRERIEQLKKEIAEGRFNVDPETVADKLLRHEFLLNQVSR